MTRKYSPPLLFFVVFCFWFSLYTYPSIFTPYLDELGASPSFSGVAVGSYGFTQMILRLPAGVLSDKLEKRKIFVAAGLFFSLISAVGLSLTSDLWLILILRALSGVAAAMWVQMTILYMSYFDAAESWRATGRINFANTSAIMLATLSGGILADRFGWQAAFILATGVAGFGFVLCLFIHEPKDSDSSTREPMQLKEALLIGREKLLLWASVAALLAQLLTFATAQGFVPMLAKSIGATTDQIAVIAAVASIPRAVSSLFGGSMVAGKRISSTKLIFIAFIVNGISILTLPLTNSLGLLVANQMIYGFGSGILMTLLMGLCTRNIAPRHKSSAMGFYQAVYGIGMVSGPILVGGIADWINLSAGFVLIGIVSLLAAGYVWKVLRPVQEASQV